MNMFEARVSGKNVVAVGDVGFATETDLSKTGTENIKLGIRSEFIELATKKTKNAIQVKVKREVAVPGDKAWLKFPKSRCCVYADETLV